MELSLHKLGNICLLSIGVLVLLVFSFQYPFTAKIPLGNDTPIHIQLARFPFSAPQYREISTHYAALKATYPLSSILFAIARFLPFTWPQRFIIWMALGHLLSGLALGYLLKKIAGVASATIGMIFWAISVIGVLSFVEVGFMPQLWSMIFLLIFMERLLSKSFKGSAIALIATWFAHPGTFIVCTLALVITLPQLIVAKFACHDPRKCALLRSIAAVTTGVILILLFIIFYNWPGYIMAEENLRAYRTISYYLSSQLGIIIPFIPIGFFVFINNRKLPLYFRFFFVVFGITSMALGLNSLLGIGVLESRFEPFMVISIIIFGSLGLIKILTDTFSFSPLRYILLIAILFIASFQGWSVSADYLNNREKNKIYQSLTPSQEEVFQWMKKNLPPNAVIAQNDPLPDGVIKWLPVISDRGSFQTKVFAGKSCTEIIKRIPELPATHVIFFTKYETVPEFYQNNPQLFKIIYNENDVQIFQLPIEKIKDSTNKNTLCIN